MEKISRVKQACIAALCAAFCYVLPVLLHPVGLGGVLSPMHIPVLLCGLVCGGGYGALCGLVGPLLSSLLSGMPGPMMLPRMIPELMAYGLAAGLCMKFLRTGHTAPDLYISMVISMVLGRIVGGIATTVFMTVTSGHYSIALWLSGYFAESLPGIAAHLILVPGVYFTLEKSKLIGRRYE